MLRGGGGAGSGDQATSDLATIDSRGADLFVNATCCNARDACNDGLLPIR